MNDQYWVLYVDPAQAERLAKAAEDKDSPVLVEDADGRRTHFFVNENNTANFRLGPFNYSDAARLGPPLMPDYVCPEAWKQKRLKQVVEAQQEALRLAKTLEGGL